MNCQTIWSTCVFACSRGPGRPPPAVLDGVHGPGSSEARGRGVVARFVMVGATCPLGSGQARRARSRAGSLSARSRGSSRPVRPAQSLGSHGSGRSDRRESSEDRKSIASTTLHDHRLGCSRRALVREVVADRADHRRRACGMIVRFRTVVWVSVGLEDLLIDTTAIPRPIFCRFSAWFSANSERSHFHPFSYPNRIDRAGFQALQSVFRPKSRDRQSYP